MFILCKKLKRVKGVLRDFNKFFSKIGEGFDGKKSRGKCSMFDVRDSF
jgi:hypothetical protein